VYINTRNIQFIHMNIYLAIANGILCAELMCMIGRSNFVALGKIASTCHYYNKILYTDLKHTRVLVRKKHIKLIPGNIEPNFIKEVIWYTLPNGKVDGNYVEYWAHKRRRMHASNKRPQKRSYYICAKYANGQRDGLFISYNRKNLKLALVHYSNGVIVGICKYVIRLADHTLVNGVLYQNVMNVWYDTTTRFKVEFLYAHGELIGVKLRRNVDIRDIHAESYNILTPSIVIT